MVKEEKKEIKEEVVTSKQIDSSIIGKNMLRDFPITKVNPDDYKVAKGNKVVMTDRRITFDAFFSILVRENKNVQQLHEAPIRQYIADKMGITIGKMVNTKEGFNKILENY